MGISSFIATFLSLALVLAGFVSSAESDPKCSTPPAPISIRFGDVALSSADATVKQPTVFGLEMVLGDHFLAAHIDLLEPDIGVSEGTRTCSGIQDAPRNCYVETTKYRYPNSTNVISGGIFDGEKSDTFQRLDSIPRSSDETQLGEDTVKLGNATLDKFQFRFRRTSDLASILPAYIGLNNASSLLETLVTSSSIPSKTWSFFAGWLGIGDKMDMVRDGSLVIGGYDSGILAPDTDFTEFAMDKSAKKSCPFAIEVEGVQWLGLKVQIKTYGPTFTACIDPGNSRLEFPPDIWIQLRDVHRSSALASFGSGPIWADAATENVVDNQEFQNPIVPVEQQGLIRNFGFPDNIPPTFEKFSMTMKIRNGPNITIPGHQIMQRRREINKLGFIQARNGSQYGYDEDVTRIAALTRSDRTGEINPVFGLPFLAGAYFMVNYENSTFGLAPIPTDLPDRTSLVPISPPSCYADLKETETGTSAKPIMNAKSIAGAIVGSLVGGVLVVVGGFLLWRKFGGLRHKRQPEIPPPDRGPEKDGEERYEAGGTEAKIELSDGSTVFYQKDSDVVHQLPDDYGRRYELP